ncbi:MAG: DoxX family protein [Caldilineaceae bacterium]
MQTTVASPSTGALWTGRIVSALTVLFFIFDGVTKVIKIPQVIESTVQLGYQESHIVLIGILMLLCTAIYVIPQTAVLGAILLTGYLGGAVATHLRAGSGAFPIIFTIVFGGLVWLGPYLRNPKLRALVPLQK